MSIPKEELICNYTKAIREGNAAVFAGVDRKAIFK